MKRLLSLGILYLILLKLIAQPIDKLVTKEVKLIGVNHVTNTDIQANEYFFPERIHNFYIDTTTNLLSVQLRGTTKNGKWLDNTGKLILFDLINNTIRWTKKLNYQQGDVEQLNNMIIQSQGNKSFSLNIENGENLWEVKNNIYYVEPFRKVGLGYKFRTAHNDTNILEGIDLTNGTSIWNKMLYRPYGWNGVFHLNDSVIVIVSSGLHSVNLRTGLGWDYDTKTGMRDYTPPPSIAGAASAALSVVSILAGTFVMSSGNNTVSGIVSNVLIDSSDIYFASKEKVSRLSHDGQIIWSQPLPEDLTSNSSLFIKGTNLYLVNKGYAYMGYRQINFGTPFFTSFDLVTGKQNFMTTIKGKRDQISSYIIRNDTILLVFKDKVAKYSMINGSAITEKSFETKAAGELKYFLGSQVYFKTDSTYKSLAFSDSTKYFLYANNRIILVTNLNLDILDQIDFSQLYIYFLKTKDFKFLAKGNETVVLDNNNRKVADLKVSRNAILLGTKLYDRQEKSFIEIDLHDLIKN